MDHGPSASREQARGRDVEQAQALLSQGTPTTVGRQHASHVEPYPFDLQRSVKRYLKRHAFAAESDDRDAQRLRKEHGEVSSSIRYTSKTTEEPEVDYGTSGTSKALVRGVSHFTNAFFDALIKRGVAHADAVETLKDLLEDAPSVAATVDQQVGAEEAHDEVEQQAAHPPPAATPTAPARAPHPTAAPLPTREIQPELPNREVQPALPSPEMDTYLAHGMQDAIRGAKTPAVQLPSITARYWYYKGRTEAEKLEGKHAHNTVTQVHTRHTTVAHDDDDELIAMHAQEAAIGIHALPAHHDVSAGRVINNPFVHAGGPSYAAAAAAAPTAPEQRPARPTAAGAAPGQLTNQPAATGPGGQQVGGQSVARVMHDGGHKPLKGALKFNTASVAVFDGTLSSAGGDFGMWIDVLIANCMSSHVCIAHALLAHTKVGSPPQRFVYMLIKKHGQPGQMLHDDARETIVKAFRSKYDPLDREKYERAYASFLKVSVKQGTRSIAEYDTLFDVAMVEADIFDEPDNPQNQRLLVELYQNGLRADIGQECTHDPITMIPYKLLSVVRDRALKVETRLKLLTDAQPKGMHGAMAQQHNKHKHKQKHQHKQSNKSYSAPASPRAQPYKHDKRASNTGNNGAVQGQRTFGARGQAAGGWNMTNLQQTRSRLKDKFPRSHTVPFFSPAFREKLPPGPAFSKEALLEAAPSIKLREVMSDRWKYHKEHRTCVLCCHDLAREWEDSEALAKHTTTCGSRLWYIRAA